MVALRKESVDRNGKINARGRVQVVALRKESVDRNPKNPVICINKISSLSARRAWIEIFGGACARRLAPSSLSARRAWIEIVRAGVHSQQVIVALRKESVDRNTIAWAALLTKLGRSPQGERG